VLNYATGYSGTCELALFGPKIGRELAHGHSTHYLQIDFKRQKPTAAGGVREGSSPRTIVVEVCTRTSGNSGDSRFSEEEAAEIACTTACELARRALEELANSETIITRLAEFPPVLRDVQPDVDEPGVRAWLLKG